MTRILKLTGINGTYDIGTLGDDQDVYLKESGGHVYVVVANIGGTKEISARADALAEEIRYVRTQLNEALRQLAAEMETPTVKMTWRERRRARKDA